MDPDRRVAGVAVRHRLRKEAIAMSVATRPLSTVSLTQRMMPSSAEIAWGRRRLHRKAFGIVVLWLASYTGLVFLPVPLVARLAFALGLVLACVATATSIMHDANHGAFSRSRRVNRVVGFSADLLGASSFL